jgi:hypothetical protein
MREGKETDMKDERKKGRRTNKENFIRSHYNLIYI